jgi:hypothetical protein
VRFCREQPLCIFGRDGPFCDIGSDLAAGFFEVATLGSGFDQSRDDGQRADTQTTDDGNDWD